MRVNLDTFQPQMGARLAQELSTGTARLGEDDSSLRTGDLEWNSRQARPGAHIDKRRGKIEEPEHQQAIDVVLQDHVLEVMDTREVKSGVGRSEQLMIGPEQGKLGRTERDAAALQNDFQRGRSGFQEHVLEEARRCHSGMPGTRGRVVSAAGMPGSQVSP